MDSIILVKVVDHLKDRLEDAGGFLLKEASVCSGVADDLLK